MKRCFGFCLACCALLLCACGSRYAVSVDSLRDPDAPVAGGPCLLIPGNADVGADDLLFREVSRLLEPAFREAGYPPATQRKGAAYVAKISYWPGEPATTVETGIERGYRPIRYRGRVRYVPVERTTMTERTVYSAHLLLECYAAASSSPGDPAAPEERLGPQVWRTEVSVSGKRDDFRALLAGAVPALNGTLGTRTDGARRVKVVMADDGEFSISEN